MREMEIVQMYAPAGSRCRPGYTLRPGFVTIHNTANTGRGAGAEAHARYLRGTGKDQFVSWHYAVDERCAAACIPENEVAWHAGDGAAGPGNRRSLSIEICENADGDLRAATDNAAQLAAQLLARYGLTTAELVQHSRWSGKDCPRRLRRGEPYTWAEFVQKVETALEAGRQKPLPAPLSAAPVYMSCFATGADRAGLVAVLSRLGIGCRLEENTLRTDAAVSAGDQRTLLAAAPAGVVWKAAAPPAPAEKPVEAPAAAPAEKPVETPAAAPAGESRSAAEQTAEKQAACAALQKQAAAALAAAEDAAALLRALAAALAAEGDAVC